MNDLNCIFENKSTNHFLMMDWFQGKRIVAIVLQDSVETLYCLFYNAPSAPWQKTRKCIWLLTKNPWERGWNHQYDGIAYYQYTTSEKSFCKMKLIKWMTWNMFVLCWGLSRWFLLTSTVSLMNTTCLCWLFLIQQP